MLRRLMMAAVTASPALTASLLHFDGTNGSTTFTDETGKTWTATAGPTINTANAKYGTGCGYFPYITDTDGYITTPYSDDFAFGSGDFTIQFWAKFVSTTGFYGPVICLDSIGGTRGWRTYKDSATNKLGFGIDAGGTTYVVEDPSTVPTSDYAHFAVVRDGGMLRLYRDGVQVASTAISGSANAPSVPCVIGALWGTSAPVNTHRLYAYLDDLKVTKGYCEYPDGTTFTPPTGPLS